MRRSLKVLLWLLAGLAVLLAVNTIVINQQTKNAGVTIEGGEVLDLPGGSLQVLDSEEPRGRPSGPPVVLVHCYACSLHWWDPVADRLAEERRVVRVDLLGFGGSEKPADGYGIEAQASLVASALNELGVEGAVAVGHSLGGGVVTALAEQASELVDRVILVASSPDTENYGSLPFLARLAGAPVIGQAMWRIAPDGAIRSGFSDAFAPGFDVEAAFPGEDRLVEDYRAMSYPSSVETRRSFADYTLASPLHSRLGQVAVPAMAILGSQDEIVDTPEAIAAYREVPGLRAIDIPEAGHSPNVETPDRTADLILGFSETDDPPSPRRARRGRD